ncbi:hypothetical protein H8D36_02920 [archaeon]|nr:hypothetical protein [archaeon]MBL7057486.1 hypothetical protein [Candidatus Woesearchaeota archaeon]
MKNVLIICAVIVLMMLASCSSDVDDGFVVGNDADGTTDNPVVNDSTGDVDLAPVVDPDPVPDPEPIPVPEPVEELDLDNLLIDRRVGDYDFEDYELNKNKDFLGYKFDFYAATYSYGETEAVVAVLVSDGTQLGNLLNKMDKDTSIALIDGEDLAFTDKDIYFNPYDNFYAWVSDDKVIVIQHSIGTDLLEKYLDEYEPVLVDGYFNGEVAEIELESENLEKTIFYNGKKYVFEMDLDGDNILLSVNDEEFVFEEGDESLAGNLMIKIQTVSFSDKTLEFHILKYVPEAQYFVLSIGEDVSFEMGGRTNTLSPLLANSEDREVVVEFNGNEKTYSEGATKSFGDYKVKLSSLLISNIGEDTTTATIDVWLEE